MRGINKKLSHKTEPKIMRTKVFLLGSLLLIVTIVACIGNDFDDDPFIPEMNFVQTAQFEENLSAYRIFNGNPSDLVPTSGFHLLELSSPLFTDYAHKQRLVKVPEGTYMKKSDDDMIDFPDGTLLVKTFFYLNDERDEGLGKRVIETRLLIKESSKWNAATYIWNEAQTDATLEIDGSETDVSWVNTKGKNLSTLYKIPSQNECGTCHQSNSKLTPLGPNLRNLNRIVAKNHTSINQISHLQTIGILDDFAIGSLPSMVNYKDLSATLEERGRAYLEMNCAHCHNPNGWEKSNQRRFDFRYEISLGQTGISDKREKILRTIANGRMPFIGTSMIDEEGIQLIRDYLKGL